MVQAANQEDVKRAYKLTLGTLHPAAQVVLEDLAKFCGATETPYAIAPQTGEVDVHRTFVMMGRHEVWMRIQAALNLDVRNVFALTHQSNPARPPVEEKEDV